MRICVPEVINLHKIHPNYFFFTFLLQPVVTLNQHIYIYIQICAFVSNLVQQDIQAMASMLSSKPV